MFLVIRRIPVASDAVIFRVLGYAELMISMCKKGDCLIYRDTNTRWLDYSIIIEMVNSKIKIRKPD